MIEQNNNTTNQILFNFQSNLQRLESQVKSAEEKINKLLHSQDSEQKFIKNKFEQILTSLTQSKTQKNLLQQNLQEIFKDNMNQFLSPRSATSNTVNSSERKPKISTPPLLTQSRPRKHPKNLQGRPDRENREQKADALLPLPLHEDPLLHKPNRAQPKAERLHHQRGKPPEKHAQKEHHPLRPESARRYGVPGVRVHTRQIRG